MEESLLNLQCLIDSITLNTNMHICIHDVSGILNYSNLIISRKNQIHSKPFCDAAKDTPNGLRLCLTCKYLSNQKAMQGAEAFVGDCPYGIKEIVKPVIINGNTACIIYIGNLVTDFELVKNKINKTCRLTKLNENNLLNHINSLCHIKDINPYFKIAQLIHGYIMLAYDKFNVFIDTKVHWSIEALKNYAITYYNKDITISQLAKLYYLNENYLGRVFKKNMGLTFNQYLNGIRVKIACKMIRTTKLSIANIAYNVGFNNVTYFNRVFKNITGKTPYEYRSQPQINND